MSMTVTNTRYGTKGKQVTVSTNYFPIIRLPEATFYQYDPITGTPELKNQRRRNELINKLQTVDQPQTFSPRAVYDGNSIMFVSHRLRLAGGDTGQFFVSNAAGPPQSGARGTYCVQLTLSTGDTIRPGDLKRVINAVTSTPAQLAVPINLVQMLIRAAPNLKYPNNGKAYFPEYRKLELSGGFELRRGYFQSVRPVIENLLINIDTSVTAMYQSGRAIDVALSVIGKTNIRDLCTLPSDHRVFHHLRHHMKGLLIHTTYPVQAGNHKPVKTIRDVVPTAGQVTFIDANGVEISVQQHYQQAYNYRLRHPDAPGFVTTGRSAPIRAVVPMELCDIIPGQMYRKKLPQHLTEKMVSFSVLKPKQRFEAITIGASVKSPVLEYANSDFVLNSGMKISTIPLEIIGRILATPNLSYGKQRGQPKYVTPNDGKWNVRGQQFITPARLVGWGVINFEPQIPQDGLKQFIEMIMSCCTKLGMYVGNPLHVDYQANPQAIDQSLAKAKNGMIQNLNGIAIKYPLVIVILPKSAKDIKTAVKRWGDITEGIATQCCRVDKLWDRGSLRANDQYCNNVALKINMRLGGTNWAIDTSEGNSAFRRLAQKPFMIMGCDVSHPGPGLLRPSIASLVWSYDAHGTRYCADTRLQGPRQESVQELKSMVNDAIVSFGQKNKCAPVSIVFYRDGLSEGEYATVAVTEIAYIKAAIDECWIQAKATEPKPKLTFIVVGKRHHTLFFPKPQDADKSGNAPAGFVADKGLSHPSVRDFYLQSHGGLLGTSRPAHYIVLKDDNFQNSIDDLQELSFALTHLYAKATRSVSIPAPIYYADLTCGRASYYFDAALDYEQDDASMVDGQPAFNLQTWQNGWRDIHKSLIKTMYFL